MLGKSNFRLTRYHSQCLMKFKRIFFFYKFLGSRQCYRAKLQWATGSFEQYNERRIFYWARDFCYMITHIYPSLCCKYSMGNDQLSKFFCLSHILQTCHFQILTCFAQYFTSIKPGKIFWWLMPSIHIQGHIYLILNIDV